jgi:GMP synthase (glutamine-hydrolysing)
LARAGLELEVCRPYAGDEVSEPRDHVAVVVLGGAMGANDDLEYPWLTMIKKTLVTAVDAGLPTLGICLGHQLLAVACGGTVAPNPHGKTAGLRPVRLVPEPEDPLHDVQDPLHAGLPADAVAIHWNDDVVHEVPSGASVLAHTDDDRPQVVRFGSRAWGVQFHPEVTPDVVAVWARHSVERGEMEPEEVDARLAAINAVDHSLQRAWTAWADRFAHVVGSSLIDSSSR